MNNSLNKKIFYLSSGFFGSLLVPGILSISKKITIVTLDRKDTPVEKGALKHNARLLKVTHKKELELLVENNKPEILLVGDFGIILTEKILRFVPHVINIHPSLLPEYRGPSPISSSIVDGKKETGVSIMKVVKEIDAGPIYAQERLTITQEDNQETLTKKLAKLASSMIEDCFDKIVEGKIEPRKQAHDKATFTSMTRREKGLLDWKKPASLLEQEIKAYILWPTSFTNFRVGTKILRVKIIKAVAEKDTNNLSLGKVIEDKNSLKIKTAKDLLSIKVLQVEGKKESQIKDFLSGYRNIKLA